MHKIDFASSRRRMHDAAIRNDMDAAMREVQGLASEILKHLNDMLNDFDIMQAVSIVAALDRYRSIVLDLAEARGEDKKTLQRAADELNEKIGVACMFTERKG